jgi:hypothetical protein
MMNVLKHIGRVGICGLGLLLGGVASGQPAPSGGGGVPAFRALVSTVTGTYRDYSRSDAKGMEQNLGKTTLSGTEVQVAGSYTQYELELGSRLLAPKDLPWWSRRSEMSLGLSYYWPAFRFVQPLIGFMRTTQTGDQEHADAPPAFIDVNTVATLGLKTSFVVYSFGTHGFMAQGRVAYNTSFEKVRNFGDESYAGLGYFFATGRFKAALVAGQMRSFFRAEKPEEDADLGYLTVRHTYVANRIGLYMEY